MGEEGGRVMTWEGLAGVGGAVDLPYLCSLPDLMLVLPFSSPCSLQPPSSSLWLAAGIDRLQLCEPLLQGTS